MNTLNSSSVKKRITGRRAALRLLIRIFLFLSPFWAIMALYLIDDPFMSLHRYQVYDAPIRLNENIVEWGIYKNAIDARRPFNSFILGNSCTMAFRCGDWERYLHKGSRAMRLFGNSETLAAVNAKLQALERDRTDIDNALIVLDISALGKDQLKSGFEYILPAEVSGRSRLLMQFDLMRAFFRPDFLFAYLRYKVTGTIDENSKCMNPYGRVRDSRNNDCLNPREKMIAKDGEKYWQDIRQNAAQRKKTVAPPCIYEPQAEVLRSIAMLLKRHHTSYRFVISPDFDEVKLNPKDLQSLKAIFGQQNVFDFSGKNAYSTDYHNFYESAHYRPCLGRQLLKEMYRKEQK